MRVDLLVVNAVYHNFFPNPKLRFQCYSRQVVIELKRSLKWNQVVIELKRSGRLFNIAETFV